MTFHALCSTLLNVHFDQFARYLLVCFVNLNEIPNPFQVKKYRFMHEFFIRILRKRTNLPPTCNSTIALY